MTSSPRRLLATTLLLALSAGCATVAPGPPPSAPTGPAGTAPVPADHYALLIDAGSSGSRLYVYQWRHDDEHSLPRVWTAPHPRDPLDEPWERRVASDLDSLADDPEAAAASLQPLLDYARDKLEPLTDLTTVPLWLFATGGVRELRAETREPLLAAVRRHLEDSPFDFREARPISGEEEATFGWVAVNHLLGLLGRGGAFPTAGVLDLGGSSSQIAFVPLDLPRLGRHTIELGGDTYPLYVASYAGQGQDDLRRRIASRDCWPLGYPIPPEEGGGSGRGDWFACKAAIREAISAACPADEPPCSLMGKYQPPHWGEFVALSVYAYTARFYDLRESLVPIALERAGNGFCSSDWERIVERDPSAVDDPYLPGYCFAAAYITTLLTDGYGFPITTERVAAPLRIQGSEATWALGAAVFELAH